MPMRRLAEAKNSLKRDRNGTGTGRVRRANRGEGCLDNAGCRQ
jgi:hypothetical protein